MDLTLLQPTNWGAGWTYSEVDGVYYRSQAPWPSQGTDVVLTRTDLTGFGDEPANWQAATVSRLQRSGHAASLGQLRQQRPPIFAALMPLSTQKAPWKYAG